MPNSCSSSLRAPRSNAECIRGDSLDCFVASLLAMTEGQATAFPRHDLPGLCPSSPPGKSEGAGNAGSLAPPRPRVQCKKHTSSKPQVAETVRHSLHEWC